MASLYCSEMQKSSILTILVCIVGCVCACDVRVNLLPETLITCVTVALKLHMYMCMPPAMHMQVHSCHSIFVWPCHKAWYTHCHVCAQTSGQYGYLSSLQSQSLFSSFPNLHRATFSSTNAHGGQLHQHDSVPYLGGPDV